MQSIANVLKGALHDRPLIVILIIALAIRLGLFGVLLTHHDDEVFIMSDSAAYMQMARNLVAGHGFSQATSEPYIGDGMRTPLLPIALAGTIVFTGSMTAYIGVQIVLALVLIKLTFEIALRVMDDRRIAYGAAALMAFEPYAVFINLSFLTETLFIVIMTGAFLAAMMYYQKHDTRYLCAASALCALGVLARPIAQFLPILLIALGLIVHRRSLVKVVAAALIPFMLVSAPWLIRNHQVMGKAAFSTGGFQNVYSDLGGAIIAYRDHIPWYIAKKNLEEDFAKRHNIDKDLIQQDLSLSPVLFKEGLQIMIDNPKATLQSFGSLSVAFLTNDSWAYYPQRWGMIDFFEPGFSPTRTLLSDGPFVAIVQSFKASHGSFLIPLAGRLFWLAVLALCTISGVALYRRGGIARMFVVSSVILTLYYMALTWSAGDGANGRYRYPLDPMLFTGASIGAWYVWQRGTAALARYEIFNRYSRVLRGR